MFVEGAILLAWNIAWLCKTQGMGGLSDWRDICPIGRNLYNLLLSEHRTARANAAAQDTPGSPVDGATARGMNNVPVIFGKYSHGSAHSFLGLPEGIELTRDWRLQSFTRVSDKIRAHLQNEMQSAEWDVLEEDEWRHSRGEDQKAEDEPVIVGGRRRNSVRKPDGKSGWTRLRHRNNEDGAALKNSGGTLSSKPDKDS
jgi:hypothetical protein